VAGSVRGRRSPRGHAPPAGAIKGSRGSNFPDRPYGKSTVNVSSKYSKKTRIGRLPYGTAALVVHSTRIVQTIYGSIQEYGGFDRPEWLD
jgi:hypothetical protein